MCKECHDKAPNTKSRKAFLQWAKSQCYVTNTYEEIMREIKVFGLEKNIDNINEFFKNGTYEHIKQNIGLHFNQKMGGVKITTSSIVAAIAAHLHDNDNDLLN